MKADIGNSIVNEDMRIYVLMFLADSRNAVMGWTRLGKVYVKINILLWDKYLEN